jgi:hypothetical protein
MSEQDKRVVYMGNFERFKKETQVKQEDIVVQLTAMKLLIKYSIIIGSVALGVALVALAM